MKISKIIPVASLLALLFFWKTCAAISDDGDGTLAHHLATNALARAGALPGTFSDELEFSAPAVTNASQRERFTGAKWSQNFWLKNVAGLAATPIGFTNLLGGQGLPTMISPRHYLCATHMHCESYTLAFLDTNNTVHFRKVLQRVDLANDTSVGILDADLPPAVGFLPVLPENFTNELPADAKAIVQGIGMNQGFCLFSAPLNFSQPPMVLWNSALAVPGGLGTNWTAALHAGDSSCPAMILVRNQLVLVSHNYFANGGPNYALQIPAINAAMHRLSTNQHARTDYQLTVFPLAAWR
jgi:hypothetical protein